MLRTLLFFIKLAVVVFVAVWLAQQPGEVTLEWLGYRVDTSVGVLLFATFLFGIFAALVYRFWGSLWHVPGHIGDALGRGRRRRGYRALTQGMVAVAAGDKEEARRWARKADGLLDDAPLTMLLSAQAAQLEGDERAAKRYFESMLDNEETRFLGLRGLLVQALREGDDEAARSYLERAHRLRPDSAWVLESLFDLSERSGDLEGAEKAVKEAARHKLLPAAESNRKRALLLVERAAAARGKGQSDQAVKLAKEARKLAPDLVPATLLLARLHLEGDRPRDTAKLAERAWAEGPHPELAALYRKARGGSAIEAFKAMSRLVAAQPNHPESLLALAEAALDAELWGEARRYLAKCIDGAAGERPGERVCRLMARLEESERDDAAKARQWLLRAADAPADPAWVCDNCGAVAERWSARCGACKTFDGLGWTRPRRVAEPVLADAAAAEPKAATPVTLEAPAVPTPSLGAAQAGSAAISGEADSRAAS